MHIVNTRSVNPYAVHQNTGTFDPTTDVVVLEPGGALGRRAQSPVGIVLVLEGSIALERDSNFKLASAGMVVVMPTGAPQMLRNVGDSPARIVVYTPARGISAHANTRASVSASAAD